MAAGEGTLDCPLCGLPILVSADEAVVCPMCRAVGVPLPRPLQVGAAQRPH